MLIAHLSDLHVGAPEYRSELLRAAVDEVRRAQPQLVIVAGDLTDAGRANELALAKDALAALEGEALVLTPGNHDARDGGQQRFEELLGPRDSVLRTHVDGGDVTVVAVDTAKEGTGDGEVGAARRAWIAEAFQAPADLRIFVCHHHLVPVPGASAKRDQVLDAGELLSLLRQAEVDLVLAGHRHIPYVWPIGGMLLAHAGTASTVRTRGFPHPAYNLVTVADGHFELELKVPGGGRASLGAYPRQWPRERWASHRDPLLELIRADGFPTPSEQTREPPRSASPRTDGEKRRAAAGRSGPR